MSIVHFSTLENIEETLIMRSVRGVVIVLAIISTYHEDLENGINYTFLTNMTVEKEKITKLKTVNMALFASLLILVFSQLRIEWFKRSGEKHNSVAPIQNDAKKDELKEESIVDVEETTSNDGSDQCFDNDDDCLGTKNKTLRILVILIFCSLIYLIYWFSRHRTKTNDPVIARTRTVVYSQLITKNVVHIFLIKRNSQMYKYCIGQCKEFLFLNKVDVFDDLNSQKPSSCESVDLPPNNPNVKIHVLRRVRTISSSIPHFSTNYYSKIHPLPRPQSAPPLM